MTSIRVVVCACALATNSSTQTQSGSLAIPVRILTRAIGTDSDVVRDLSNIRPLSNGRVLVNDLVRMRVVMFDSTLLHLTIVLDAAGPHNSYGAGYGTILPYLGDSTAFLDQVAKAFVIIDPTGMVSRTIAVPRASDIFALSLGYREGSQAFDPQGRLIFKVRRAAHKDSEYAHPEAGHVSVVVVRDSGLILRVDPLTKAVDTLAVTSTTARKVVYMSTGGLGTASTSSFSPLPEADAWTLLPDGTLAIVRSHDYHIDWVSPTGTVNSTPRLPFDWRRLTAAEKQSFADSSRKRVGAGPPQRGVSPGVRALPGLPYSRAAFTPDELPDYYPSVREGQAWADPEGNVWILPTTTNAALRGLVYDVVNRKGEMFERVQLPEGRKLIGLGAGGVVYMSYTPRGGLVRLERARILR